MVGLKSASVGLSLVVWLKLPELIQVGLGARKTAVEQFLQLKFQLEQKRPHRKARAAVVFICDIARK